MDYEQEIEKLERAVDEFAIEMKKRLIQKVSSGFRGWDRLSKKERADVLQKMFIKTDELNRNFMTSGKKDLIDVANFAMMLSRPYRGT